MRILVALATLALAAPALAGGPATHEVLMFQLEFQPLVLNVAAGDTVRWHNADDIPHTATLDLVWDSGEMFTGDAYERTFDVPGVFPYRCVYHPLMVGAIVVGA